MTADKREYQPMFTDEALSKRVTSLEDSGRSLDKPVAEIVPDSSQII